MEEVMKEIKIRYIVRHIASGNVEVKHYYLGQIEQRPLIDLSPAFRSDYELLIRGQFTGLKDKNGEEIYEGDILKSSTSYDRIFWDEDAWSTEVMKRHKEKGGWIVGHKHKGITVDAKYGEVIGNIYQHPHLLQE
jgi:YopX protein